MASRFTSLPVTRGAFSAFCVKLKFVSSAWRIVRCTTLTGTCWSSHSRGSWTSPLSLAGWRWTACWKYCYERQQRRGRTTKTTTKKEAQFTIGFYSTAHQRLKIKITILKDTLNRRHPVLTAILYLKTNLPVDSVPRIKRCQKYFPGWAEWDLCDPTRNTVQRCCWRSHPGIHFGGDSFELSNLRIHIGGVTVWIVDELIFKAVF